MENMGADGRAENDSQAKIFHALMVTDLFVF